MTKTDLNELALFTSLIRIIQTHEGHNGGDRRVYSVAAPIVWLSYCIDITNPDMFFFSFCSFLIMPSVKTHCYMRSGGLIQAQGSAGVPKAVYN